MKAFLWTIPLLLAFCVAHAGDDAKKPDTPAKPPAGTDGTWSGTLTPSQGGGVAVLHLKQEKDKKETIKELVLWAETDSLKNQISDSLTKHVPVKVSGLLAPDNANVKVTSVEEDKKKRKGRNNSSSN